MKIETLEISLTYRGSVFTLSPETSLRVAKLAKGLGLSVEDAIASILSKEADSGGVLLFSRVGAGT